MHNKSIFFYDKCRNSRALIFIVNNMWDAPTRESSQFDEFFIEKKKKQNKMMSDCNVFYNEFCHIIANVVCGSTRLSPRESTATWKTVVILFFFFILITDSCTGRNQAVTNLGLSSTSDVITFDQNWHYLYWTFAGGKDPCNDTQIGLRTPEIWTKMHKDAHYTWPVNGKNCPPRWRFLRNSFFKTASKPMRKSVSAAKRK